MRTVLKDLPHDCRGCIVHDGATGEDVCVLNSRLTWEANRATYKHELEHLRHDDLHCAESADELEWIRHRR